MSSPPASLGHQRHYSWTPSLAGDHAENETQAAGEVHFSEHARGSSSAQHLHSPQDEHASRNPSSQSSLRSFMSRFSPFSNRPNKEFVVTRRRRAQSRANMEGDKDNNSAPSSRTVTPGVLESLDSNQASPKASLPPSISVQIPDSTLQEGPTSQTDTLDTPPPTAVSAQSSKSVTFASPVRSYSPRRYYADLPDDEASMLAPYNTDSNRRSVSSQHNIDSPFVLTTRTRSTDSPIQKLKKRASTVYQRRRSSLPPANPDEGALLIPQRSASSSSSKSLSDHLAFLRFPSKSKRLSKQNPSSPATLTTPTNPSYLSDLPTDRTALEGRINYHISRLDRLKCRLADISAAIRQETAEYGVSVTNLQRQGMASSIQDLNSQLQWLKQCRDGLRPLVGFHRGELDRIACKRVEMDVEEGYEAALPAVYANLDGDEVWEARFGAEV